MNVINSAVTTAHVTKIFVAVLKREYRRLFKIVNLEFSVRCRFSFARYTAISIKVVPKKREKVEYERERLIGKD